MNSSITNRSRVSTKAIIAEAGLALAANRNRVRARIQNLGTNPLFVKLGDSAADETDFTVVLPANTVATNGTSAPYDIPGYTGAIYAAGTSPSFVVSEDTI